ncbi:MAG: glucosamine-6-phosphate deaminase [Lachnospiraceae bacterium]|nr:glucosamine-6-phosphate deaminase [Lachnospiraceae bacterium]
MRIYKAKDYEAMSHMAADFIASQIILKPNCVLGLATGTTPIGTYNWLRKKYEDGRLDFSEVHTVNLDEYVGLAGDDPNSYRYFMNTYLFDHVNIDKFSTHVEDGTAKSLKKECQRYEKLIRSLGGVDLQLLGIGNNGHIGFCEPADAFSRVTHIENLTESTIQANSRLFEDISQVPTRALTMGVGTIMRARRILLIASGSAKQDAIRDSFFGDITPRVPASALQLHQDVTVIADEEALAKCDMGDDDVIVV